LVVPFAVKVLAIWALLEGTEITAEKTRTVSVGILHRTPRDVSVNFLPFGRQSGVEKALWLSDE
jgi:hypothetical protein